jgi:hypothetical protein
MIKISKGWALFWIIACAPGYWLWLAFHEEEDEPIKKSHKSKKDEKDYTLLVLKIFGIIVLIMLILGMITS